MRLKYIPPKLDIRRLLSQKLLSWRYVSDGSVVRNSFWIPTARDKGPPGHHRDEDCVQFAHKEGHRRELLTRTDFAQRPAE